MMKRIVVGVTGASGTPLAYRLLETLQKDKDVETHLVMTRSASLTASYELSSSLEPLEDLCDYTYAEQALDAAISSGSFETAGMIVIPCSMKTVAGIASGFTENLLLRAADVTIKEKRPLVLAVRESPLSAIHLKNMSYLATLPDVTIMPPLLTYYHQPESIDDIEKQFIARVLKVFDITPKGFKSWGGLDTPTQ